MDPGAAQGGTGLTRKPWRPAGSVERPVPPARSTPGIFHLLLFMATVVTTSIAGVGLANRPAPLPLWVAAKVLYFEPARLLDGVAFSAPLLASLFSHEMGHYLTARAWKVQAGWPFFVPMPMGLGTMGALIPMDGSKQDRRALVEIGAAGPLVGFVVAFLFLLVGLWLSPLKTADEMRAMQSLGAVSMPESMALGLARWLVFGTLPPEREVAMHPIALAGWYGLYLTWFNLLPFGQLDGGHLSFAVNHLRSVKVSVVTLLGMPLLWLLTGSVAWIAVGVGLVLLMVMGGLTHPEEPTGPPLGVRQKAVLVVCVVVFLLCFVADPLPRAGR